MTTFVCPSDVCDPVVAVLRCASKRQRVLTGSACWLTAMWAWGAGVLVAILIDAIVPMSVSVRVLAGVGALIGLGLTVWKLRPIKCDVQRDLMRQARRVERRYALKSNPLVNALCLIPVARGGVGIVGGGLTAVLARRALARVPDVMAEIDMDATVDRAPFRRQRFRCVLVVMAWLIVAAIRPELVGGGLARFVAPFDDHPPFSFTGFEIEVQPGRVAAGQDAVVTATLTGSVPGEASLVQWRDGHGEVRRWPMRAKGNGEFRRTLVGLREPIVFYVESPTGRSRRYAVTPVPRDTLSVSLEKEQDDVDETREDSASRMTDALVGGESGLIEQQEAARNVVVGLGRIAGISQRIRELAREILRHNKRRELADTANQQADRINEQLDRFQTHRKALAGALRNTATQASEQNEKLTAAASATDRLDRLRLIGVGRFSMGVVTDAGRIGIGGTGDGSGADMSLRDWLEGVESAAVADAQSLNEMIGALDKALNAASDGRVSGVGEARLAKGVYTEASRVDQSPMGGQWEAMMQQVPMIYREAVAAYFTRLVREQSGDDGRYKER